MPQGKFTPSLCWDCKRACCGCSWSQSFTPIRGWVATPTKLKLHNERGVKTPKFTTTYVVHECPQFERDATGFGMKWTEKPNTVVRRKYKKK